MEKLYYSIAEVSKMLEVNASNLRFWEKEFKQLKPRRNAKGTRFYTREDIDLLRQIMYLVNEKNLTLAGAKQQLNQKKDSITKQVELVNRLTNIKSTLKGILNALN